MSSASRSRSSPRSPASAQLIAAKDGPIVYGHHHLVTSNVEAQKKFLVGTLGGQAIAIGTDKLEIIQFPNVLIFFRQAAPKAATKGTTVNHIGFSVPNLRQTVDKVKAAGYPIITGAEVARRTRRWWTTSRSRRRTRRSPS